MGDTAGGFPPRHGTTLSDPPSFRVPGRKYRGARLVVCWPGFGRSGMTAAIRRDKAGKTSSGNGVELRTGDAGALTLRLCGHWRIGHGLAAIGDIEALLDCE